MKEFVREGVLGVSVKHAFGDIIVVISSEDKPW